MKFTEDYVGLDYHDDGHTHVDALCHVADEGRLYNACPEAAVTGPGLAVSLLRDVLLGRGVPWREPGEHVFSVDPEAAGREQRVWVGEGDIPLVRTGHSRRLVEVGPWNTRESKAGLDPTALRFVGSRAAAALGSPINPLAVF